MGLRHPERQIFVCGKLLAKVFLFFILSSICYADTRTDTVPLLIEEQNGTNAGRYRILKVTNGTSTNNNDGSVYVNTGGGGGSSLWQLSPGNVGINTTNNVGIGSISPVYALDVTGTVRATTSLITGSGAATITGDANGNIGIGSATPGQKLDVAGTVRATGGIIGSFSGILKGTSGTIGIATSGTDYAPATSGTSILYGNGSGGFSNVSIGTNMTFSGGSLSSTGGGGTPASPTLSVQYNNAGSFGGSSNYTWDGSNSTQIATNANFTGFSNFVLSGYTSAALSGVTLTTTSNVGIGSTSPQASLDLGTTGTIVSHKTTGIGWSEHNATNQACNTTCGSSACVVGIDIGTVGVVNSGFVSCTDSTADDCLCAGP